MNVFSNQQVSIQQVPNECSSNECGLKWMSHKPTGLKLMRSQINTTPNECSLKWTSHKPTGLKSTNLNSAGLKWMQSQMNVVSNKRVTNQQVSNGCSLRWMWSLTNESQTNRYLMNVVSNEVVSIVCTPKKKSIQSYVWKGRLASFNNIIGLMTEMSQWKKLRSAKRSELRLHECNVTVTINCYTILIYFRPQKVWPDSISTYGTPPKSPGADPASIVRGVIPAVFGSQIS